MPRGGSSPPPGLGGLLGRALGLSLVEPDGAHKPGAGETRSSSSCSSGGFRCAGRGRYVRPRQRAGKEGRRTKPPSRPVPSQTRTNLGGSTANARTSSLFAGPGRGSRRHRGTDIERRPQALRSHTWTGCPEDAGNASHRGRGVNNQKAPPPERRARNTRKPKLLLRLCIKAGSCGKSALLSLGSN